MADPVIADDPRPAGEDRRPHSRACGWRRHDHGAECHSNCPTCGGRPAGEATYDCESVCGAVAGCFPEPCRIDFGCGHPNHGNLMHTCAPFRPAASGGATDREREATVSVSECTPYGTCPVHGNNGHTRWGGSTSAPVTSHGDTTGVNEPPSRSHFAWADAHRAAALHSLQMALTTYKQANLPADIKTARVAALGAKIDALSAIRLNDAAYPWSEDGVL